MSSPSRPYPLTWASRLMLVVATVAALTAFTWPLLIRPSSSLSGYSGGQVPMVLALVLPLVLAVVLTQVTSNGIDVKGLAMLGVLTAVGAALRPLGTGTAGVETVFFLLVLAGRAFGPGFGFVLGPLTMFASALLTGGVGPWLPYQMLAAGLIGLGAGLLPFPRLRGRGEIGMLASYGFVMGFVFGMLMDLAFWPFGVGQGTDISYVPGAPVADNLRRFLAYNVATALGWNLGRALSNLVLVLLLGRGLLLVMRRASRRAAFTQEPVSSSRM